MANTTTPTPATQETQQPQAATQQPQAATQEPVQKTGDNAALFELLNKVIDQRSDGIAKSALKSNGVDSDDDAKSIIAAWKQQRETAQQQTTETLTAAQQENATLKAQILQMQISAVAQTQAAKMGIDVNSLPYITKLADFGDAMNEKGDPDPEKINAALQKVIDDVPAFRKTAAEQKGFVKVGGDGGKDETATEAEQKLRKAFGLK